MNKITKKRIAYFWILSCILAIAAGYLLSGCGAGGGGGTGGGSNPPVNPPSITNVSPASVKVGDTVTIDGNNFGATRAPSTVSINGALVGTYSSWSNTQVKVVVPNLAPANANAPVVVSTSGGSSNAFSITVNPFITSLNPNTGSGGDEVTITGTSFGNSQGTSRVTFTGTNANIINWSNSAIRAQVPNGINSGNVVVTVAGIASNGVAFTIGQPHIDSLSPTSGTVGTTVTINGSNFGSIQGSSAISFNGTDAGTATSWTATQIIVTVPTGATTGNVVVTTGAGASNGVTFTITPTVYYKLVDDREYNIGAGLLGLAPVTGTSQGTVLAVVMAGEIVLVNPNNGSILYQTSHNCGGTGIGYFNGYLYVCDTQIKRYPVNLTAITITETPDVVVSWGSGSTLTNITVISALNSIAITSNQLNQVAIFNTALQNPPTVYNLPFGAHGMVFNDTGTIGWATAGDSLGSIAQVNFPSEESSTWVGKIPFAWSIDRYQETLFLTGPNIGTNSWLSWYQSDGTLIGQTSSFTWYPQAIRIYYNSGNSSEEAAVTGDDGKLHIYKVVEN